LNRRTFSVTRARLRSRTFGDEFETWGVRMALSSDQSGLPAGSGSVSNTSSAAPPIRFYFTAAARADSSTIGPRAMLMTQAVGFRARMISAETMPRVCGVSAAVTAR